MFDCQRVEEFQPRKLRAAFDRLKSAVGQSVVKTLNKVTSESLEAKIVRIVVCEELGVEELMSRLLLGDVTGVAAELSKGESALERPDVDKTLQELRGELVGCLVVLAHDVRRCMAANIDIKFDYYNQHQTYQHMQVINSCTMHPIKTQEHELCKYYRLMVAKVLLHIRTGQAGHVYDIFVSLFDIVNDPGILGINKAALAATKEPKWRKPDLFGLKED